MENGEGGVGEWRGWEKRGEEGKGGEKLNQRR